MLQTFHKDALGILYIYKYICVYYYRCVYANVYMYNIYAVFNYLYVLTFTNLSLFDTRTNWAGGNMGRKII